MALRGCFGCLKFLVFVVNFLFWLFGLGIMAVSLWLLFDQQLYLQSIGAERVDYFIGTYIILGIGSIMTLVGFLGCCGAWKGSPWMLGTFFFFLTLILIGEFAICVLIYFQEEPHHDVIINNVKNTVTKKYHPNSTATTQTFDFLQEGLECCGAEGPEDWSVSLYNGYVENSAREIGIPNTEDPRIKYGRNFKIPSSCCITPESLECTNAIKEVDVKNLPKSIIHTEGCSDKIIDFVDAHAIYLIAVGGGIFVIQTVGMIFSLCLCCALKRIEDFKS